MTKNGIVCKTNNKTVLLDPKIPLEECVNFVSHAHSDHLPTQNGVPALASIETSRIAKLRGCKMDSVDRLENFSLLDSGHILGARGLSFDNIFYTGDICTRSRGFLSGAKIPKCKTLITECTFGLPEFIFPKLDEIKKTVNEIISEHYSRGIPVILFGYQLGKAQTISQLFGHWEPLYYHDSVKEMNDLHRTLGINLKECIGHTEAEKNGLLEKKPWVMVAPFMSEKSYFIKHMKSKYGAATIGFSGWAKSSRFSFGRRADFSIPLSDHCDFDELVELVKKSGADKVYTIHGFVEEFSAHLKSIGIDAQPLREESLDDFI
ncbi:MAG: exonuclease [Thaumarchaeota archaeon]|nr:exonuclease [Nitrososphaerota archaeon]